MPDGEVHPPGATENLPAEDQVHGAAAATAGGEDLAAAARANDEAGHDAIEHVLAEARNRFRLPQAPGDLPQPKPGERTSLEFVVSRFVARLESLGRSPRTIDAYLASLLWWPEWWPESIADLAAANDRLKVVTEMTVKQWMVRWKTICKFAEQELGLPNPLAGVATPRVRYRPNPEKILTVQQVQKLIDACEIQRDVALVTLVYTTGIRLGEIPLFRAQVRDGHIVTSDGKTGVKLVPIVPAVQDLLAGVGNDTHLWLDQREFLDGRTRPLTQAGLVGIFKRACRRAGIPYAVHRLRHSFAVHCLDNGLDIRHVQELMGHASIATTELYTPLSVEKLRERVVEKGPFNNLKMPRRDS